MDTQQFSVNSEDVGSDCIGSVYRNIEEMWKVELTNENSNLIPVVQKIGSNELWYSKQAEYWEKTEATVNGVLGGFEKLNKPDVIDSKKFLILLNSKYGLQFGRATDCGAGVGRITKELLLGFFKIVDVNDQNPKYIEACKENFKDEKRVELYVAEGLQKIQFTEKYDCFWIQWVCNYLTDTDFVSFLIRCKNQLADNGVIVIKENIAQKGFIVDKEDSSVTRSDKLFMQIFDQAGLVVLETQMQTNFPKDLYKVKSYALRAKPTQVEEKNEVQEQTQEVNKQAEQL